MIVEALSPAERQYPVVVVGTGFGSLFFVHRLLQLRPNSKILMLERGTFRPWEEQLAEKRNSAISPNETFVASGKPKLWNFTIAYGGGTNCWYTSTPRLHPSDFRLRSLYGRAQDWPISYEDLEPYYAAAEAIMDISGPDDLVAIAPRSQRYPQPPHKFSSVDRVMKQAQPEMHFALPTARARVANAQRPQCCASFRCDLCPVGAKFTALNGLSHILEHPNVHVLLEAEVLTLEKSGAASVGGVRFVHRGKEQVVGCDLCVLGANSIHSPAILLRSGIDHPLTGRGLHEQLGYAVEVLLERTSEFSTAAPFRWDRTTRCMTDPSAPNTDLPSSSSTIAIPSDCARSSADGARPSRSASPSKRSRSRTTALPSIGTARSPFISRDTRPMLSSALKGPWRSFQTSCSLFRSRTSSTRASAGPSPIFKARCAWDATAMIPWSITPRFITTSATSSWSGRARCRHAPQLPPA